MTYDYQADEFTLDEAHNRLELRGHAQLSSGGLQLRADSITADLKSGELTASGGVSAAQEGRIMTGDQLVYNPRTGEGELTHAEFRARGAIVKAERIELFPDRIVATESLFTVCDLPHPHVGVRARRITVLSRPGAEGFIPTRATASGAKLFLYGLTTPRFPSYHISLTPERSRKLPLPSAGYSRNDGLFAGGDVGLPSLPLDVRSSVRYRVTTRRGLRYVARAERPAGWGSLELTYSRLEDLAEQNISGEQIDTGLANVFVNRRPEARATLSERPLGRSFRLQIEAAAGNYSESPTGVTTSRQAGLLDVTWLGRPISRKLRLRGGAAVRRTHYGTGSDSTITLGRIGVDANLGVERTLGLTFVRRLQRGETPFQWDRVEVARALAADLAWRFDPRWRIEVRELYDLDRQRSRDIGITVGRTVHCLEWQLSWRQARRELSVGINLAPF